jgi:hypothetical protein
LKCLLGLSDLRKAAASALLTSETKYTFSPIQTVKELFSFQFILLSQLELGDWFFKFFIINVSWLSPILDYALLRSADLLPQKRDSDEFFVEFFFSTSPL